MNFDEAEARFRWLEGELAAGRMSMEQYRAALNELRVVDAQGRQWMLQERTGQWHWFDGARWQPAMPPRTAPPPPAAAYAPPPPAAYAQAPGPYASAPAPTPAASQGGGCGRALLYLGIATAFWGIVAIVVYIFWGQKQPQIMLGIGLAALISFVIMGIQMLGAWEGQIIDIRRERVRTRDSDGDWHTEDVNYAYIREPSGKTRKMRSGWGWQVGDYLIKRRGDPNITKVKR